MFRPSSQAQAIHHANPEINSIQSRAEDRFGETFLEQPGHISFFILFSYTGPFTTYPRFELFGYTGPYTTGTYPSF